MKITPKWFRLSDDHGFVLVTALVFLMALTLLGILSINTSTFERYLTGNERVHTDTFYESDSGIGAAIGLIGMNIQLKGFTPLERNAMRDIGFDALYNPAPTFYMTPDATLAAFFGAPGDLNGDGVVDGVDTGVFLGQNALGQQGGNAPLYSGTFYRDAFFPRNPLPAMAGGGRVPTTSLKIDVQAASTKDPNGTELASSIKTEEGSSGNLGTGIAQGGAMRTFDIRSRHDAVGAASQIHVQYKHIIGK